jgi:Tat protein translocase TatB subunit
MFDVGFWELALIFMLGLMVLGPEKLPRIAAQIGRWVGRARRTATQLRYQLEREINLDDRPQRPYTPPPKTSHIVPPPGAQRTQPKADEQPASETGEAETTGDDGSDEPDRNTGT